MTRVKTRLVISVCLVAALGLLSSIVASAAGAAGPGGAQTSTLCGTRHGPNLLADPAGSWYQQTNVEISCPSGSYRTVTATLRFTPCLSCGFIPGNVVSCTAILTLYHLGGSYNSKYVSCTAAAKMNNGDASLPASWTIGAGSGNYYVGGFVYRLETGFGTYVSYNSSDSNHFAS